MLSEMILFVLCLVALLIFCWDLILQMRLRNLEKKIKEIEARKDK